MWRGEIEGVVCFQNTLIRLRAKHGNDPGYVAWWARFAYESGLFASIASGANIYHLGAETVRELPARVPPPAEQRLIAARLHQVVSLLEQQRHARLRQAALVLERRRALITSAFVVTRGSAALS